MLNTLNKNLFTRNFKNYDIDVPLSRLRIISDRLLVASLHFSPFSNREINNIKNIKNALNLILCPR